MTSMANTALWRRILLIAVVALTALIAVSSAAPQDAHAIMDPTTVLPNKVGWVKTAPVISCMALTPECMNAGHTAYRWTGYSWQRTRIAGGIDVYVYPYSSPWHWIWTQRTGWLAIPNSALETGYRCYGYACPVF